MKKVFAHVLWILVLLTAFSSRAMAEPEGCYTQTEVAVQYVRDQMKTRTTNIPLVVSEGVYRELDLNGMTDVFAHTMNPDEGDALLCASSSHACNAALQSDGNYLVEYVFTYYDTGDEEQEAQQAIRRMADELELANPEISDLEKIQRIYNKVTYTVTYDTENLYTDKHPEKFTAYSAAVEGVSVCQGISSLIYRLALSAGIECRIITSAELDHAWNIVKWNDLYYCLDATWDLENGTDFYFMRGKSDFYHVNADDAFQDAAFAASHPMSETALNMLTQDNTLPILGYLQVGETHTLDGGRTLHLTSDRRNKVLVFFRDDCPFVSLLLQDFADQNFGDTDLYFCEFNAFTLEDNQTAADRIHNELSIANNVVFLRNDWDYATSPGNTNYDWMREMETESGIIVDFLCYSPTVFLVNGDNQILYAYHGYNKGMPDLIRAYFSAEASTTAGMIDDHGSHSWDDTHVIARPTASTPGTKIRICTKCGKTETYRVDAPGAVLHGKCGDHAVWSYNTADNSLTISGSGELWDRIHFPDAFGWLREWETPAVTSSRDYFYANQVKKITIGSGIEKIGGSVFNGFSRVTELVFPEGITEIGLEGYPVCDNMSALTSVTFPSTLKKFHDTTPFYNDPALKTITFYGDAVYPNWLPNGVTINYPKNNPTWTPDLLDKYESLYGCIMKPFAAAERADTPGSWKRDAVGWWYQLLDGTYPKNEWDKIGGKWYHFDAKGYMQTGWQQLDNSWYYFTSGGYMLTGWQKLSDKWFYFETNGAMATGWQKLAGKWYYFASSGTMQTGWQKLAGKWYYFSSGGTMQTGWQMLGSKWFYFAPSGYMMTGWQKIDGKEYYFKDSGVMAANEWCNGWWLNANGTWTYKYKASWSKNTAGWWYGDTSGWYAKNCTITIDGKSYTFNAGGYLVK